MGVSKNQFRETKKMHFRCKDRLFSNFDGFHLAFIVCSQQKWSLEWVWQFFGSVSELVGIGSRSHGLIHCVIWALKCTERFDLDPRNIQLKLRIGTKPCQKVFFQHLNSCGIAQNIQQQLGGRQISRKTNFVPHCREIFWSEIPP